MWWVVPVRLQHHIGGILQVVAEVLQPSGSNSTINHTMIGTQGNRQDVDLLETEMGW